MPSLIQNFKGNKQIWSNDPKVLTATTAQRGRYILSTI
uniref:Uncharacterized protein n=1 Tax=Arundo donax TaxID=35708 RepID=A0A0A8YVY3_ARUDO